MSIPIFEDLNPKDFKKTSRSIRSAILTFVIMLFGMTVFEITKHWITQDMTIWESHIITILISSLVASLATFYFAYKFQFFLEKSDNENIQRKKAEKIQRVLYNILNATMKTDTLEKLIEAIHSGVNTLMEAENFYLALYDKDSDTYSFPYYFDEYDVVDPTEKLEIRKGFTEYVRKHKKAIILEDGNIQELQDKGEIEFIGSRSKSWMGVPLLRDEEPFGVVAVQSYTNADAYNEDDLNMLTYVSGHISMSIERKQTEEALFERDAHLSAFFSNAAVAIAVADPKGNFIKVNNHYLKLFGYENEAMLFATTVGQLTHPDDRPSTKAAQEKLASGEIDIFRGEKKYIRKDGSIFWGDISVSPIEKSDGSIEAYIAIIIDVTENKNFLEALSKSENQLAESQRVANIGSYSLNMATGIWTSSTVLNNIFGIDENYTKDINGWTELIHPEDRDEMTAYFQEEVIGKRKRFDKEYRLQDFTTKEEKWIHGLGELQFDDDDNIISMIGTIQDITDRKRLKEERKKLEEQLLQSQKMESIGRLAGGIAHDFNNILASIMGYAELLILKLGDPVTSENKAATVIYKSAQRAAKLTQQLLGFARSGKYEQKALNVNRVIEETIKVSEKIFEKQIDIISDYYEPINTVSADKNQLDQIFTNIFINAKDAMPNGGELCIKTENMSVLDEEIPGSSELTKGDYVRISFADNGMGMSKEVSEKIFEPFFTTKSEGKGTGLGLASVYGIVKNHDGFIYCESELGVGTTFTIYLPASDETISVEKKKSEVILGHATILVVDDEKHVLDITKEALESIEYTVLTAESGLEAIEIYKREMDSIDLIILDIIMPVKSGKETYRELKEINSEVRILLSSGYSQKGQASEIIKEGVLGFIQKPFSIQELSEAVADAFKK